MNKLREKSKVNRLNFNREEIKTKVLKSIVTNCNFTSPLRWKSSKKKAVKTKVLGFKTTISNRCLFTVSKKSFNKKFKMSRLEFLRKVRFGDISGFQKAVW